MSENSRPTWRDRLLGIALVLAFILLALIYLSIPYE